MDQSVKIELIKNFVEEFFGRIMFQVKADVSFEEGSAKIMVTTTDAGILIGEKGEVLFDIQHILKLLLKKQLGKEEIFSIDLDINEYKKKKIELLKSTAMALADEVAQRGKEKILPPMSAYERKIIHLELSQRNDVFSESIGEEPERRIVIKPRI